MSSKTLISSAIPLTHIFRHEADYDGRWAKSYHGTAYEMDPTSLAAGSYIQSDVFSVLFGNTDHTENDFPAKFSVDMEIDFGANTPDAGATIDLWYVPCQGSSTAELPMNLGASAASWDGYSTNGDEAILQAKRVGSLVLGATSGVQVATKIGVIMPEVKYGVLILRNNDGTDALDSDAINFCVRMTEVTYAAS